MSEERDLNPADSPDRRRREMEDLLRSLVPQPLAVERDVLFFEAGLAAANRAQGRRLVWPAVAAMLLVACGGLALALEKKSVALDAALAATRSQPAQGLAVEQPTAGQGSEEASAIRPVPAPAASTSARSRRLDDVLSDRRPGRQLTAQGWVEASPGSAAWLSSGVSEETRPTKPANQPTYLQLLRSERS